MSWLVRSSLSATYNPVKPRCIALSPRNVGMTKTCTTTARHYDHALFYRNSNVIVVLSSHVLSFAFVVIVGFSGFESLLGIYLPNRKLNPGHLLDRRIY